MLTPTLPSTEAILVAATEIGALGVGKATLPRVLAALCDPGTSASDVGRVIAQEPGLAARVLRVANSAYYGLTGKVSTLERAFVLLGGDAVRGIAAAACLDRAAARALDRSPIDLQHMLRHFVATGSAAEMLARGSAHRRTASEAFIAGLLHDFGVAVQVRVDLAAVERLIKLMENEPPGPVREAEARAHCVGHERCVALVFESWKLPANLVAAVLHHHEPLAAPAEARVVSALVCVANHVAISAGLGYALEPHAAEPVDAAIEFLRLPSELVQRVTQELPRRVEELQQQLGETQDQARNR
jgi:HD-like signal output (HDOD) protein